MIRTYGTNSTPVDNKADCRWEGQNPYSGFTPSSTTGIQLWFDASQETSSMATSMSIMTDWSGNGKSPKTTNDAYRPVLIGGVINGYPAFKFDGTEDHLRWDIGSTMPITGGLYIIAVMFMDTGSRANAGIFTAKANEAYDYSTGETCVWSTGYPGVINASKGYNAQWRGATPSPNELTNKHDFYIYSTKISHVSTGVVNLFAKQSGSVIYNGNISANNTITPTRFAIGARWQGTSTTTAGYNFLKGYIAEFILCDGRITNAETASLENYFANKYSLVA